ncbi:hypothetical protein [Silanimonas sp.]|jgi:hypothetical protein|uniref:hypothetical protein n=1 Tax=Silanimonas sp. TaxID=1929290 RepID=UPI0037CBA8D6
MTSTSFKSHLLVALLVVGVAACSAVDPGTHGSATPVTPRKPSLDEVYGDWRPPPGFPYPAAAPFDITRKGTAATLRFSVPPMLPGEIRPSRVQIVFRASSVRGPVLDLSQPDSPAMKRSDATHKVLDRLKREPIPIRLQVWRVVDGERVPVVLEERVMLPQKSDEFTRSEWVPSPGPVYEVHDGTATYAWQQHAVGLEDPMRYYREHRIAAVPRVPGEYLLEAEVLAELPGIRDNPEIDPLSFDLLVATPQPTAF